MDRGARFTRPEGDFLRFFVTKSRRDVSRTSNLPISYLSLLIRKIFDYINNGQLKTGLVVG